MEARPLGAGPCRKLNFTELNYIGEIMNTSYWQGEIVKRGDIIDLDFPQRDTKEEALADAASRAGEGETASASEWERTEFGAVSTGKNYTG
jgi:hypothetical protein